MSSVCFEFESTFKIRRQVFHLPDNFSPENLLPTTLERYCDHARWIVHRIVRHSHRRDRGGYVRLKRRYLEQFVPERILSRLLEALTLAGVIECDRWYVPSGPNHRGKAYGYRLAPEFDRAEIKYVPVSNGRLAGKMARAGRGKKAGRRSEPEVIRHLARALQKVEIAPEAEHIAADWPGPKRVAALRDIHALEHRVFDWKTGNHGRLFTNITRLKKELRPDLRLEGQHLAELDISNSQPLFLALWLIGNRRTATDSIGRSNRSLGRGATERRITVRKFAQPITEYGDPESGFAADEIEFICRVQAGHLYEVLASEIGDARAEAKAGFWPQVLFGKKQAKGPVKRAFKRLFPTVLRAINRAKSKDHRRMAQALQKLESDFVLHTVCRRIMHERPEVDLLTVHDSWLCLPHHLDYVRQIAEEEFHKLGVQASLRTKEAIQV